MQTEIDLKGMHKMTIQTVCNPKILLKLIESYEQALQIIYDCGYKECQPDHLCFLSDRGFKDGVK